MKVLAEVHFGIFEVYVRLPHQIAKKYVKEAREAVKNQLKTNKPIKFKKIVPTPKRDVILELPKEWFIEEKKIKNDEFSLNEFVK